MAGEVTFEVVPTSKVKDRQKELLAEYAQACMAYVEARKSDPEAKPPKKPAFAVLQKSVKGKDKAEALAAKYREKYEAKKAKKEATDEATPPSNRKKLPS